MAQQQVRRMPVVNREKRLVGVVSIGHFSRRGRYDAAQRAFLGTTSPAA
jgi:CBS-domain-containing membrane protein